MPAAPDRPERAVGPPCGRGNLRFWDVATGHRTLHFDLSAHKDAIGHEVVGRNYEWDIDFSPDGRRLVLASMAAHGGSGGLDIWERTAEQGIVQLRGLRGEIQRVKYSASGRYIAAISQDWKIGVWDTQVGQLLLVCDTIPGAFADNADIAFDPSERLLAYSTFENAAVIDIRSRTVTHQWVLPPGLVDCLSYLGPDELYLLRSEPLKPTPDAEASIQARPKIARVRNLFASDPLAPVFENSVHDYNLIYTTTAADGRMFVTLGKSGNGDSAAHSVIALSIPDGALVWNTPASRQSGGVCIRADTSNTQIAIRQGERDEARILDVRTGHFEYSLENFPMIGFSSNAEIHSGQDRSRDPGIWIRKGKITLTLGSDVAATTGAMHGPHGRETIAWGGPGGEFYLCNLQLLNEKLQSLKLLHPLADK